MLRWERILGRGSTLPSPPPGKNTTFGLEPVRSRCALPAARARKQYKESDWPVTFPICFRENGIPNLLPKASHLPPLNPAPVLPRPYASLPLQALSSAMQQVMYNHGYKPCNHG